MNKYETVFIIDQKVEEAEMKQLIQKFTDLINSDGKVEEVNEMGKRKLAYEIKKNKEAYYVCVYFEANPALIKELERIYRITDEVIKFIVIRRDENEEKKEADIETEAQTEE